MRTPTREEREDLVLLAQAGDEEGVQLCIAEVGLPEEVASRWYAYIVEGKPSTEQEVNHLFNKSWT